MDQTQLLDWHGESDPEEPSDGAGDSGESPKPVGRLHLLRSKYGPEKDFWIYQGKNLIGRHDSCQICLPVSSVSKAHAVIEVPSPDGPHLLYDQESLNRTRRQRMVLLPHVRYSLQDGDTLVFGDVGCQYFMLDPQGAPESPDDSLEVPPTQPRTDTSGLVIEETPVPGRKMGFGAFLVQDSDREEEGEEVVNGVGKIQYLPVDDGSDSSTKHGARGHCSLASSMLLSPSATVVPESDEESGEPLEGGPSCPSLRLRYESDDAAPRSLANGAVTPLEQEMHPVQPGSAEAKVPPDSGRQPGAKGQGASADPSLVDFHLDSDTDMEDEGVEGTTSERPPVKDDFALELGSNTDAEQPSVVNPGSADNGQLANDIDSDTDIEEAEKNPSVLDLKAHQVTENRDSDMDAEGAMDSPGVASPESQESSLRGENSREGEERAGSSPGGDRPHEEVDSDTDVEAVGNPAAGSKSQLPAKSEDDDTDAEEQSFGAENQEGIPKDHKASRDSDTDVEVDDLEPGRLGGAHPHSPQPARNKDSDADVEEIKGIGLQGNSDVTDNARGAKNTGVEPPKGYGAAGEQSAGSDVREPIVDTEAVEQLTSAPQNQHLLAISVDSDTDVEEAAENPNESSEENCKVTSNGPSGGNQGSCSGNLEIGPGEDEDSDPDVEVTSPSPKTCAAHNSDTDVEVVTSALPGKHLEEQDTQLVFVRPSVDGEGTASSAKEPKVCCDPSKEDEDTDAEGNGSHPGDESDTDDEGDSDLAVQATQCYLPAQTSSPKAEKARDMADPRCALEEEATQAFVFRSPSSFAKFHPGKICSSPLKDEDPDIYMLEATQPYCKEPATLSEEPTQAFVADAEEDTELFVQRPIERGQHHSEQAARPAVPISATGGRQGSTVPEDPAQPHTVEVSRPEPDSQPAGGAAAEESHKEEAIQTVPLVQVPPSVSSQPLAPLEVDKTSGSEEQVHEAPFEGGVAAEVSQSPGGAGHIKGQPEERCSEPAGGARGAEQLSRRATKEPSKPVALVSEQRRGLRSSAASSPPPLPERRSRQRCGWAGSADPDGSRESVAPPARRRGLRQLANPTRHTGEPERKAEETKAEEANPGKTPSKGEPAVSLCQGRVRRLQRGSRSAAKPDGKTATAAGSPVTEEPARPRKRRVADAPEPVEEEQLGRRWTRSSRQSGDTSETTLSPKDSGKGTKVGQGPAPSAPSSGRRSRRQSTESKTAGATQSRSRSSVASAIPTPKVLFTGVIDEEGERVVTELGGSLAESVLDCTHLVTDRVCRTVKFLCALARGIPIVTLDWLEKSKRNSFFLSPKGFLVRDPEQEKNFGFRLAESLQKARQKGGLLQGYELHVTPNVKPEPEHMRDIIKCSGGTFLPRMPRAYKDKRIVISCPEDLPRCKPAQDAGVPIANSEFILTGILQQKADLDAHRLGGVGAPSLASPAASATRASKRRAAVATAPAPPSTAKRRR
uniref:mediator of DNA damage checkpoint protein 1 n=1 Tax=Euleptes europaea TaxID=460621 RepID=UPI0025408C11|nr:mediator of DNA damage checkpoint protein 1 [Euleptes europaea]